MHKSVADLFAERKNPKHCGRSDLMSANGAILALGTKAQMQVAEYRARLVEAENDPGLPDALRGKTEMLSSVIRAVEKRAGSFMEEGRALTRDFVQLDRDLAQAETELEAYYAKNP